MLRRSFFSRFAAIPLFGASQASPAQQPPDAVPRHPQDAWLDAGRARHRVVFDTWMADKFPEAIGFAGNWLSVNREAYGLGDADLDVLLVVRHGTTPFAFNERIWTKYGAIFAANMSTNNK